MPKHREKLDKSRLDLVADRLARTLAGPPLAEQNPSALIYGDLPSPILIALLPLGLWGLCNRRWVLWLCLPLFVLIYANYGFFLPHYAVAIVPAVLINVLAAKIALARAWPSASRTFELALLLVLAAIALTALPQLNSHRRDQWFPADLLRDVDQKLAAIDRKPAVVLFKFDPDRSLHEEPVYNMDVANPDDAAIVRAHDLAEKNSRLFAYYATRSPNRAIYRFDEKGRSLRYLGTAADLNAGKVK